MEQEHKPFVEGARSMNVLIIIRNMIIALGLAWIGVTLEPRADNAAAACEQAHCEQSN